MDFQVTILLLSIIGLMMLDVSESKTTNPRKSDESCNPVVDMLFVLDNSVNVSETEFQAQKRFVSTLLKKQNSPKGAARIAIMVCDVTGRVSTPFSYVLDRPFQFLDTNVSKISDSAPKTCLENVNYKIKTESRDSVTKIVVLLKGSWNWENIRSQNEAAHARQEGTVMVVIAIGVRDFDSLSSLQGVALREETFFVVSDYNKLGSLAVSLARDACQPISLDLTSEKKVTVNTTKQPIVQRDPCIQIGRNMFKKYVPGFGYTRQRCSDSQRFELKTCSCV